MKLILSGGGIGDRSIITKKKFVTLLDNAKPLLYIPIASDSTKRPYSQYFDWIVKDFKKISEIKIIMATEKELNSMGIKDYNKFSGIFLGGGNAFRLLKLLKETGAFDNIKKLGSESLPIYGDSAGAVVLSKNIIPALSTKDERYNIVNFNSLNLLKDYSIFPHYQKNYDKIIHEFMEKYNLKKVIGIPEDSGLFVTGNKIEVIGNSNIVLFEQNKLKKEIKTNEEFI